MKKFKALVLGLTMVCAVGMFAACGKVPEVTEDDVLDALEEEGIINEDMDEEDYSVEIDETDVNEDGDRADVTCTLTVTSGYMKYETEYELKFKIRDDKESWKYRDKYEVKDTKESLAKGIDEDDIEDELSWESIEVDGKYLYFEDEITDYEVTEQKTDLEEKEDVLTIEGEAECGFSEYTFTAELTFVYDYGWYLNEKEVTDYEVSYIDGYEVEFDANSIADELKDNGAYVYALGAYYYFSDADSVNITVNDTEFDGYYANVDATAELTFNGTVITTDYDIEYYFDEYDVEWSLNDYYYDEATVTSDVFGTYTGTNSEGETWTLTIKDEFNDWDYYAAEISVQSPTDGNYSYTAYLSGYNAKDGEITIYSDEWIVEPSADSWAYMESLYGYILDGKYTDDWDESLILTKQ